MLAYSYKSLKNEQTWKFKLRGAIRPLGLITNTDKSSLVNGTPENYLGWKCNFK